MTPKVVAAIFTIALNLAGEQPAGPDEIRGGVEAYTPPAHSSLMIRTQVSLVEVPVIVRDGSRIVAGLQRGDFQITDSGRPREIASFSVETVNHAAPSVSGGTLDSVLSPANAAKATAFPARYIGFLFDDANINDADLTGVKKAAEKFLKDSFSPSDRAAIATTAWVKPPVFSADAAELQRQVQGLRSNPRAGGATELNSSCPSLNSYETYELANGVDRDLLELKIREYIECSQLRIPRSTAEQAVLMIAQHYWELCRSNSEISLRGVRALVDRMAELPGRKMIVLTSSGFLTGSLELDLDEIIQRARRAGVVINSLESRGLTSYVPGIDVTKVTPNRGPRTAKQSAIVDMQTQTWGEMALDDGIAALAVGTGGRIFENNNDLAAGYRDLAAVPDSLYVLGISVGDVQDGKYHPLKIHLTNDHRGSIEARPGYLAGRPVPADPAIRIERPIDREFVNGHAITGFPAEINVAPRSAKSMVTAFAHVDLTRVNFDRRDGRRTQDLTFIVGLMDRDGTFLRGKQARYDLALTEQTYKNYTEQGFNITLTLTAPPGKYLLRGIVAEGTTGRIVATNLAIQVH
jgi:VWFA-related protein